MSLSNVNVEYIVQVVEVIDSKSSAVIKFIVNYTLFVVCSQ